MQVACTTGLTLDLGCKAGRTALGAMRSKAEGQSILTLDLGYVGARRHEYSYPRPACAVCTTVVTLDLSVQCAQL